MILASKATLGNFNILQLIIKTWSVRNTCLNLVDGFEV